jgi:gluconate 2-dehydrogenase gamma chain
MSQGEFSRRGFLVQATTGVGAAWLAAAWPEVLAAQQHAHHMARAVAAGAPAKLEYFTAAQAAEVEAITAAIIPTTDTPGAREAGVVYFIDHSLHTFAADQQKPFADALEAVAKKRKELFPDSDSFAALSADQQSEVLKGIESAPAFGDLRFATVAGFLSNPEDGGNRDGVGWKVIGFDGAPTHTPPFGYYDAQYLKEQAAARAAHRAAPPAKGAKP